MSWNLDLPTDVIDYATSVFRECNESVSEALTVQPNTWETTLDHALIAQINRRSRSQLLPSDWVVTIETHYLGGGRHWGRWEIADIGVLVVFRQSGTVRRSKVGLLQCKRLYPNESELSEDAHENYMVGFGRLFGTDEPPEAVFEQRQYEFGHGSRYKALTAESDQTKNIDDYENASGIPVFYLLYNPWDIPWTAVLPVEGGERLPQQCSVGCRVMPAESINEILAAGPENRAPSYADVCSGIPSTFDPEADKGGWRLESFIRELLGCRCGYYSDKGLDARFRNLFGARTAAISAAFSITIDAPG